MVKHRNSSISENAARILNSKQGEFLGDDVTGPVAVITLEPTCNIVRYSSLANGTNVTIYTTPADKDFYLVAASVSVVKDATATSTRTRVEATVQGVSQPVCGIATLTLTAEQRELSYSYPVPIKIDRNTTILLTNSTAIANITAGAIIIGYTVETTK